GELAVPLSPPLLQAVSEMGRTRVAARTASLVARLICRRLLCRRRTSWTYSVDARRVVSVVTSDDQGDDPLAVVRVRDFLAHLPAATHDRGPVGDLDDVVHGMRDDDDGPALVAEALDEVEHTP